MKKHRTLNLNKLLNKPASPSEKFHAKTKIKKGVQGFNSRYWPEDWKIVHFKAYPRLNEIVLPKPNLLSKIALKNAFLKRESSRDFSKIPLSLEKLSTLLFYSAGMKNNKPPFIGRFYPSAGARYPLETYIISLNTDAPKGLYHYYLKNHSFEELLTFNKFDFNKYFIPQKWILKTACFILITAIFRRNTIKYGDRGYRQILAETGHLAQNLYLLSSALNLSCCVFDGYLDDKLNELLEIDGKNESVIYVLAIGNRI